MPKINLLPAHLRSKMNIDFRHLTTRTIVVLLLLLIVILYSVFLYHFNILKTEHRLISSELEKLYPQVIKVESLGEERLFAENKLKGLKLVIEQRKQWSSILNDINHIVPRDTWLTAIVAHDKDQENEILSDTLIIEGKSYSITSVGVFLEKLKEMKYFESATIEKLSESSNENIVTFSITSHTGGGVGNVQ